MDHAAMMRKLESAVFCPVIAGDTQSSRRLTEVVLAGCIPLFIGPPFHTLPMAADVDYTAFSVGGWVGEGGWVGGLAGLAGCNGMEVLCFRVHGVLSLPLGQVGWQDEGTLVGGCFTGCTAHLMSVGCGQLAPLLQNMQRGFAGRQCSCTLLGCCCNSRRGAAWAPLHEGGTLPPLYCTSRDTLAQIFVNMSDVSDWVFLSDKPYEGPARLVNTRPVLDWWSLDADIPADKMLHAANFQDMMAQLRALPPERVRELQAALVLERGKFMFAPPAGQRSTPLTDAIMRRMCDYGRRLKAGAAEGVQSAGVGSSPRLLPLL
jgi:hypothetical protein